MPAEKYASTRADGSQIGKAIREIVRLMIEDGVTWQNAADAVGLKRSRAYRTFPVSPYGMPLAATTY
jgi:hypothetical protein